jgi:hypothetical protein
LLEKNKDGSSDIKKIADTAKLFFLIDNLKKKENNIK